MRDCVIIGAGASGLFVGMHLPKEWKKLTLEANASAGIKILLSGKGRCNFTNRRANASTYLGDQTERLHQLFAQFGPQEMIDLLEQNGISGREEDNGRMLIASNKARDLLDFLLQKNAENACQIQYSTKVEKIQKTDFGFRLQTSQGEIDCKRLIIATGGQSFPKVGGSDFIFSFAQEHQIASKAPSPALCGIQTKEDFSSLSGSSITCKTQLLHKGKPIYEDERVVLFTHRGLSGPAIFNVSLWLGYFFQNFKADLKIKLQIPQNQMTKRLFSYLKAPKGLKTYTMTITPQTLRSRDECKVMSGGLCFEEVDAAFELKKLPGCYVLGEALNITGKTGGYNLQRCWTSAFLCAKAIRAKAGE